MTTALHNIKVVDLTRTLAGPFCTMMLGDMGADVIKIEEPQRGDETRSWTPFWNGESTQFLSFNRNKRSLSVNLKEKEGVDIVMSQETPPAQDHNGGRRLLGHDCTHLNIPFSRQPTLTPSGPCGQWGRGLPAGPRSAVRRARAACYNAGVSISGNSTGPHDY